MLREYPRLMNLLIFGEAFFLIGIFLMIPSQRAVNAHGPMGWKAPTKERKVKNPIPNTSESRGSGEKIYMDKCAVCHGLKGDGQGEMGKALNPPPSNFRDRHMMREMTDGEIYWKITTGRGPMPSFGKELSEKEIWDLVNYIKSFAKTN